MATLRKALRLRLGTTALSVTVLPLTIGLSGVILACGDAPDERAAAILGHGQPQVVEAAAGVDLVRLRLFRNEILRWSMLARGRNVGRLPLAPAPATEPPADEGAPAPPPAPIIPAEDSFNDWAFGGDRGAEQFRKGLDGMLAKRLREVESMFALTELQRKKLLLAGKGDIRRVLDLLEDARREYEQARADSGRLAELQKDLKLIELRVSSGLFLDRSIFSKTLRKMFDERQLSRKASSTRALR